MNTHGLAFHHFHDNRKHQFEQGSITADELAEMIIYYKKNYNILSAKDWYERAVNNKLSKKDVCLTFDDTLRCQFDIALPVLESLNIKAFWFVYTSPMDNIIAKLELYRYYRHKEFRGINEFYDAFYYTIQKSKFNTMVETGLEHFKADEFLRGNTFYSKEDRVFRYVRDFILGIKNYEKIMDEMISNSNIKLNNELLDLLWMNKECIRVLKDKEHIIGLHSHTHPIDLKGLSRRKQEFEYNTNYSKLKNIIGEEVVTMSHPCNSYNKDTLAILSNLEIKIGFRADMAMDSHSKLEFPRLDHAYLIKEIRK